MPWTSLGGRVGLINKRLFEIELLMWMSGILINIPLWTTI